MSRLLREINDQIKRADSKLETRLRTFLNVFLNHSEISGQEVGIHLLGKQMSKCSVAEVFIDTSVPENRVQMMKSKVELEALHAFNPDSEEIFATNPITRYAERPKILENVCLADFAAMYNFSKRKTAKSKKVQTLNLTPCILQMKKAI